MPEPKDRYPGLRSFEEADADLFFGRDEEIMELTRSIRSERVTVIFGNSGCGKSSLLNTVFKKSEQLSIYKPVKIRFATLNFKGKRNKALTPLEAVDKYLTKRIPAVSEMKIVFDENEKSLWELVKRAELALMKSRGEKLVLIFDQFEEFFLYSHAEQLDFNHRLSEIVHDQSPTRILQWINSKKTEERDETVLEWYRQPDIKIIFSIRSDKLSAMNSMVLQMPQILRNRMELKFFKDSNARDAIQGPAQLPNTDLRFSSPPIIFDGKVLDRIVQDLSNSFQEIEVTFLQIVCFTIENQVKNLSKDLIATFDYGENLYNEQIDVATILDKYYNDSINKLEEKDAKLVKKMIEDKLVVDGIRTSLLENQVKKEFGPDYVRLIRFLLDSRIIREEITARSLTYELSHDKLIGPVERSRAIREEQEKSDQQVLEAKKRQEYQSRLIQQEKAKIEEYKLRYEAYRSKEKLRNLSFIFILVSICFVVISLFFYTSSRKMKKEARKYKAEYLLAKAKDAFANSDSYLGYNFLWAADSLRSTTETKSMLDGVSGKLLVGSSISQSDDGRYLFSETKDSTLYFWEFSNDRLKLLKTFYHVRDFTAASSYNMAAIWQHDEYVIWDMIGNKPIDSIPERLLYPGSKLSFSKYGNTVFFTDSTITIRFHTIEKNKLKNIKLSEDLIHTVGILPDIRISTNGKKILIGNEEKAIYYHLSILDTHGSKPIQGKQLSIRKGFRDTVVFTQKDSIYLFDLNTGKLEPLLSFKSHFQSSGEETYYVFHSQFIYLEQKDTSMIIDLRTKKPVAKIADLLKSKSSWSSWSDRVRPAFGKAGFVYIDSTGKIKITRKYSGNPEIVKRINPNSYWQLPEIQLGNSPVEEDYFFNLRDTVFVGNFTDLKIQKNIVDNLDGVKALNQFTILLECEEVEDLLKTSYLIYRKPLTRKETRKRIPYLDEAIKKRYGLSN